MLCVREVAGFPAVSDWEDLRNETDLIIGRVRYIFLLQFRIWNYRHGIGLETAVVCLGVYHYTANPHPYYRA